MMEVETGMKGNAEITKRKEQIAYRDEGTEEKKSGARGTCCRSTSI